MSNDWNFQEGKLIKKTVSVGNREPTDYFKAVERTYQYNGSSASGIDLTMEMV